MSEQPKKVLIVEDGDVVEKSFIPTLEHYGFSQRHAGIFIHANGSEVHVARDMDQARRLVENLYDDVFLDHNVGGDTSQALVERIFASNIMCQVHLIGDAPVEQEEAIDAELDRNNWAWLKSSFIKQQKVDVIRYLKANFAPQPGAEPPAHEPIVVDYTASDEKVIAAFRMAAEQFGGKLAVENNDPAQRTIPHIEAHYLQAVVAHINQASEQDPKITATISGLPPENQRDRGAIGIMYNDLLTRRPVTWSNRVAVGSYVIKPAQV
ncbi:MAG: hypothetical protein EB059_01175 [Alphaproteobacteria bacterium]|nr:hypothetical protein [Alphaproteobacteria bacterium]